MEDDRIYSLPLFISYPRTGAHWINCVMELYFDRPRLREGRITFLDRSRNDWMWFHDHDPKMGIKHNNALYMYREPISTVYSNLIYQYFDNGKLFLPFQFVRWDKVFSEKRVLRIAEDYKRHLLKWLISDDSARAIVCYDRMQINKNKEFKKICGYFNLDLDEKRLSPAFSVVTKEALVKKVKNRTHMGKHVLQKAYGDQRNDFKKTWGATIREIVITPELRSFF